MIIEHLNTMESSNLKPIELNFKDIRKDRQTINNKIVYEILREGNLERLNKKNINYDEYKRTLEDLELTKEKFVSKCKDDDSFARLASRNISKNASRQGSKDETVQIRTCNLTAEKCGVSIKILSTTELRPTKDGSIVSKQEMEDKGITKGVLNLSDDILMIPISSNIDSLNVCRFHALLVPRRNMLY